MHLIVLLCLASRCNANVQNMKPIQTLRVSIFEWVDPEGGGQGVRAPLENDMWLMVLLEILAWTPIEK